MKRYNEDNEVVPDSSHAFFCEPSDVFSKTVDIVNLGINYDVKVKVIKTEILKHLLEFEPKKFKFGCIGWYIND